MSLSQKKKSLSDLPLSLNRIRFINSLNCPRSCSQTCWPLRYTIIIYTLVAQIFHRPPLQRSCSCSCPIYCCLLSRVQADCPVVIKLCRSFAAPLHRLCPVALNLRLLLPCQTLSSSLSRHLAACRAVLGRNAKAGAACVKRVSNQKTICQMRFQMAATTAAAAAVASRRQLGGRQSVNTLWHIHTLHTHYERSPKVSLSLPLLLLATSRMLMLIKMTA